MTRGMKEIDWDIVLDKMRAGNTAQQICHDMRISTNTFYNRFKEEFGEGFGDYNPNTYNVGNGELLHAQYKKAMEGNAQMLIWLGKVRLGQREPEPLAPPPPNQDNIDKDHIIMRLQHKVCELESKLEGMMNGNKRQAK